MTARTPAPAGPTADALLAAGAQAAAAAALLGPEPGRHPGPGAAADDPLHEAAADLARAQGRLYRLHNALPEHDRSASDPPDPDRAHDLVVVALGALGEPDGMPDLDDHRDPLHDVLCLLNESREELYDLITETD